MIKNSLKIFITLLLLTSLIYILVISVNPSVVFDNFDYINYFTEYGTESSEDNVFMTYNNIFFVLSIILCTCLICLSYLLSKK
jgi:hypothetical protein